MKSLSILLVSIVIALHNVYAGEPSVNSTPLHVSTSFEFEIRAPFSEAATLFGPESEKRWAGGEWNPTFLYPQPGFDTAGAVFTVPHGPHTSIWVNTVYDVANGRMQYVAVIPSVVATVIDVKLTNLDAKRTRVDVTYTRTALDSAANDHVREMALHDSASGPEWSKAISEALFGPH